MGCCESTLQPLFDTPPGVPEHIIPDPKVDERNVFVTVRSGLFNSNFEVYRSQVSRDTRWLYLNKMGRWGDNESTIQLENYVRGGNPSNMDEGQVLWSVKFDEQPQYYQEYDSDSDSDSGLDWDDINEVRQNGRHAYAMKWKMESVATFIPGHRGEQRYMLKCKAKGSATRKISYYRDGTMDEMDISVEKRIKRYDDSEKLKKISCKVYDAAGSMLDRFTVCTLHGPDSYLNSDMVLDTKAFHAEKFSGWFQSDITYVEPKEGVEPCLAMLMSHLCLEEYRPRMILRGFNPNWPGIVYTDYCSDYDSD